MCTPSWCLGATTEWEAPSAGGLTQYQPLVAYDLGVVGSLCPMRGLILTRRTASLRVSVCLRVLWVCPVSLCVCACLSVSENALRNITREWCHENYESRVCMQADA